MSLAMAVTSPRKVTSGYYRNHLYVLLGLNVLAALAATGDRLNAILYALSRFNVPAALDVLGDPERLSPWAAISAAMLCYVGSVVWLYEKPRAGIVMLLLVSGVSLFGAWQTLDSVKTTEDLRSMAVLDWLDPISGGLLLGSTMAAMFLGHWYLNTPSMQMGPLRRLILLTAAAIVLRALVCGIGLGLEWNQAGAPEFRGALFLGGRWLAGIVGAGVLMWMTWQTLKIPNTQSATGILYVAVIATFLGELTSQLLSAASAYPL